MSLYHKYRPKLFSEVIGNENIIESLKKVVTDPNRSHAYLLSGPTGCGKTTIGRILASELGCVGNDFREIDSADFRGIDTVREIRKQCSFKPLEGSCRVYLIDECHKWTNDAQNAMLKVLEDTPAHIYFILCTTDPQKLIAAVKNRCSQYVVSVLSDKDMLKVIRKAVLGENERIEKPIYEQIIQDSYGHPRQALQILEQVLSVAPEMRLEVAKRKAEEVSAGIDLCRALIRKAPWKEVSEILKGLKDQDPEGIRRIVLGYAQSILLNGATNDVAGLILQEFMEPFFNSGFPQVTYACYSVIRN